MKSDQFKKAIPVYDEIKQLEKDIEALKQRSGSTTTLLSVVFDFDTPYQLRGLDEQFTNRLKELLLNHLKTLKDAKVKEFTAI